jgi:hypothetical protein
MEGDITFLHDGLERLAHVPAGAANGLAVAVDEFLCQQGHQHFPVLLIWLAPSMTGQWREWGRVEEAAGEIGATAIPVKEPPLVGKRRDRRRRV